MKMKVWKVKVSMKTVYINRLLSIIFVCFNECDQFEYNRVFLLCIYFLKYIFKVSVGASLWSFRKTREHSFTFTLFV